MHPKCEAESSVARASGRYTKEMESTKGAEEASERRSKVKRLCAPLKMLLENAFAICRQ